MERSTAIRKLSKLLGKGMGYRINDKAPTKEQRAEAQAALPAARARRKQLSEQVEARRLEILAADTRYQDLLASYRGARKHADELYGITNHFKIRVGTSNGMFFTIEAEGDSWEDVIAKIEAKGKRI